VPVSLVPRLFTRRTIVLKSRTVEGLARPEWRDLRGEGHDQVRPPVMPSLGAGLVAMLAGWMIDAALEPYLGMGLTLVLSFAGSTVVFFVAQRWFKDLRGR